MSVSVPIRSGEELEKAKKAVKLGVFYLFSREMVTFENLYKLMDEVPDYCSVIVNEVSCVTVTGGLLVVIAFVDMKKRGDSSF
jgi:hypothetical protein